MKFDEYCIYKFHKLMPNIIMNHDSLTKTLIFLNYPLLIDKQEK